MALIIHLRCHDCNRLFAKLLYDREGKKVMSFKCDRCSKALRRDVYHNYKLDEIESFFEGRSGK